MKQNRHSYTDTEKTKETPRIAARKDIQTRIEKGILFDVYYDTETTDLDPRFAEITQFGGIITDLAGNILDTADYRARISSYAVFAPQAWIKQRMRSGDIDKGDPRSIFMGKVSKFFQSATHLEGAPFVENFLSMCREGGYKDDRGKTKKYFAYPVLNDDGTTNWDYIRIDGGLKKFYARDDKTGQWIRHDIHAMTMGYNNIKADDQWIWTAGHMACLEDIFITHKADMHVYRLDVLKIVESAIAIKNAGENGLKPFVYHDKRSNKNRFSLSLGNIISANTHLSSSVRGVCDGIVDAEGSHIDQAQLHGALADSFALMALVRYLRIHHHDIFSQMERNVDWHSVVDLLSGRRGDLGQNPPVAYVDKNFPVLDGKMISLIGTDQERHAPKKAVVWNLSIDPKDYTYNEKKIMDLTPEDWAHIFIESKQNPNGPLKIITMHHSPRVFDAETGYKAGFHLGLDRHDLHARVQYLARARVEESIMRGYHAAYPVDPVVDRIILPQIEEELFSFSTLAMMNKENGDDVQINQNIHHVVQKLAHDKKVFLMKVKKLWLRAIQFDEDVFLTDEKSVTSFINKMTGINKQLAGIEGAPMLPLPDVDVCTVEQAMQYKLKIIFYAKNYFARGDLYDPGSYFWVEDRDGVRYDVIDVQSWPVHKIDRFRSSMDFHIVFENTGVTPRILSRIIEELGYGSLLSEQEKKQLTAYRHLRLMGMPHLKGEGDRWMTIPAAESELAKIEGNEAIRESRAPSERFQDGAWTLMDQNNDTIASFSDYKKYLSALPRTPLLKEEMPLVGIDPLTGYPAKNHDFAVCLEKAVILDMPDRYIDVLPRDPVMDRPVFVLPLQKAFKPAAGIKAPEILLRAQKTGKIYHLPGGKRIEPPPQGKGGVYTKFYDDVAKAFNQSAAGPMARQELMALIGNGPYPLIFLRQVDESLQSLCVPTIVFEGMIAPDLVGYKVRPRGVFLRDAALRLVKGPVRLREIGHDHRETGWEYTANITSIRMVTLEDILGFSRKERESYGFETTEDAASSFSSLFTRDKKNPRLSENKAMAVLFSLPNPRDLERGMVFWKPDAPIRSRLIHPCTFGEAA